MHEGNGTEEILWRKAHLDGKVFHVSFGSVYKTPSDAEAYLEALAPNEFVHKHLAEKQPDLIIYQAGVDTHVDDPYGGVLTTEELIERDLRMFRIAKTLNIPITWNLAGGYQIDKNGSYQKVIDLHLNTFAAYRQVYLQ
jgi:acetoin utilization deacetylase AcuC-like enzyme